MNWLPPPPAGPRYADRELRAWVAAAAVALGLHALWWVVAPRSVRPAPAPPAVAGPVVTVLFPSAADIRPGPAGRDVRALWSPLLFSLPTPMGFSDRLFAPGGGLAPPGGVPIALPAVAGASPAAADGPVGPGLTDLAARVWASLAAPDRDPPAFAARPAATNAALTVHWTAGGRAEELSLPAGAAGLPAAERSWEAVARLEPSAAGLGRFVLLERSTAPTGLSESIVRLLRQLPPGAAPGGRATLRYAAPAPPPPREAAP